MIKGKQNPWDWYFDQKQDSTFKIPVSKDPIKFLGTFHDAAANNNNNFLY